jgi:hypothetical protein
MNTGIKSIVWKIMAGLALAMILVPVAQAGAQAFTPYWPNREHPILPCSGFYKADLDPNQGTKLPPCTSICDFFKLGQNLLDFAYTLLLFVVVPLSVLVGGVLYMVSGANPKLKAQAKEIMTAAIMGTVVTLCAYAAVNTFFYLLGPSGVPQNWGRLSCTVPDMPVEATPSAPTPPGIQTTGAVLGGCKGATWGNCPTGSNTECRLDSASNQYSCVPIKADHTCGTTDKAGTCPDGLTCIQNPDTSVWSCVDTQKKFTCSGPTNGTCASGYTCKNIGLAGGNYYQCVR